MSEYSIKETSAEYGKEYQSVQADKFRDRNNNHWKLRIDLAKSLVAKYVLPGFKEKRTEDIVVDLF